MDRLISWQTYAVALIAMSYFAAHSLGATQSLAALYASLAICTSLVLLSLFRIPTVRTAFIAPFWIAVLIAFALAASHSVDEAFAVAATLSIVIVVSCAFISALTLDAKHWSALSAYFAQAAATFGILLYWPA